jgi:acyl dehydratase
METATVSFNPQGLGKWTDEVRFGVTRERLIDYALATNDPTPAHRAGDVAAPVFAIVPVFESLMAPALDVVPLSLFGKILHGEQDFHFHRPIVPGDTLVAKGKMTGWEGLENGTRACVYLECRDEAGALVNEQYVTFFVRGHDDGQKLGELAPAHKLDEALRDLEPATLPSGSTTTRHFATRRPPVTRCRYTSRKRSLETRACPGSSPMVSACSRSHPGGCSSGSAGPTRRG